jgi:integrase
MVRIERSGSINPGTWREHGGHMSVTKFDYKGDPRYRVTVRDRNGKQIKRVFRRRADAVAFEAVERGKAMRGEASPRKRGGETFGELLDAWRGEVEHLGKPPSVAQLERFDLAIRHRITNDLRRTRIVDVDVRTLKDVAVEWARADPPVSDESKRGALAVIRKVFEYAEEDRGIPVRFPESKSLRITTRRKKRPQAYSDADLRSITGNMPQREDRALVYLMATTGLRIGEAFGLRIEDIDGDWLHVRRSLSEKSLQLGPPKNGKERSVRLTAAAKANLQILVGKRRTGFIYPAQGDPDKAANIKMWRRRRWKPAAEAAGFVKPVPHDLRHSYASHAIAAGANVLELQRQLGHARPSITLDIYSHEFDATGSTYIETLDARTSTLVA